MSSFWWIWLMGKFVNACIGAPRFAVPNSAAVMCHALYRALTVHFPQRQQQQPVRKWNFVLRICNELELCTDTDPCVCVARNKKMNTFYRECTDDCERTDDRKLTLGTRFLPPGGGWQGVILLPPSLEGSLKGTPRVMTYLIWKIIHKRDASTRH